MEIKKNIIKDNMKRPRIVIVSWVCSRDKELIPLQLEAIRRLDPDCPVYYIFDENDELPGPYDERTYITKSYFPRCGNLNGEACVRGMIDFYCELAKLYGNIPIIKLDADTIIANLSWVNDLILGNYDMAGAHCSNGLYFTGCCYAMTTACAMKIKLFLDTKDCIQISKNYHLPEDGTISMLAAMTGNRLNIIENDKSRPHCLPFIDMMSGTAGVYGIQHTSVCHVGQYNRLDPLIAAGLDRTTIVSRDMRTCLRFLYGKPISTRYSEVPLHSALSKK